MQFGIFVDSHVRKWDLARYGEELGYDSAWFLDSQMIWADCYVTMALAAHNTRRIRLGTGVSNPGTRLAPVTASCIGSLNELAPGRVFLGIGTGHTSMRLLGQPPIPVGEFREYLRVLRALLDGNAVDFSYRGRTAEIKFMHRERRYVNLDNRIPIYVAANAPRALQAAGAYGDGWIGYLAAEDLPGLFEQVKRGAEAAGRRLPAGFHRVLATSVSVMRPGEKLSDERFIDENGAIVTCVLHLAYEIWQSSGRRDELIPPYFANIWEDYLKRIARFKLPEKARFRELHDGHCTFVQPEERCLVRPEAIRAICLVGEPEELIARLRELEKAGVNEITFLPAADTQRRVYRDFAEQVLPAFR